MLMGTVSKFVVRQWPLPFLWPGSFSRSLCALLSGPHYSSVYRIVLLIRLVIRDKNITATTITTTSKLIRLCTSFSLRCFVCLFGLHKAFLWSLTVQPPKAYFWNLVNIWHKIISFEYVRSKVVLSLKYKYKLTGA